MGTSSRRVLELSEALVSIEELQAWVERRLDEAGEAA
jgi:hypothetical protein